MKRDPLYQCWADMRQRCLNPGHPKYPRYGARGISICKHWDSFANFAADMGPRPSGKSLDRICNGGNYEPDNCRWAGPITQTLNRDTNGVRFRVRKGGWTATIQFRGRQNSFGRFASRADAAEFRELAVSEAIRRAQGA